MNVQTNINLIWILSILCLIILCTILINIINIWKKLHFGIRKQRAKNRWIRWIAFSSSKLNKRLKSRWMKKLNQEIELIAFAEAINETRAEDLIAINQESLVKIGIKQKSDIKKAFISYILSHPPALSAETRQGFEIMLHQYLLTAVSPYAIGNAFLALCTLGNEISVSNAIQSLSGRNMWVNPGVMLTNLCQFSGDMTSLAKKLSVIFPHVNVWGKLLIVNYMNASKVHTYDDLFVDYFNSTALEPDQMDINCSIIRLLNSKLNPEYCKLFINSLTQHMDDALWPLAAVAASAIGKQYELLRKRTPDSSVSDSSLSENDETSHYCQGAGTALRKALSSKHWYVKLNSARSLIMLGITNDEIDEITRFGDRFSSEMLTHELRIKR